MNNTILLRGYERYLLRGTKYGVTTLICLIIEYNDLNSELTPLPILRWPHGMTNVVNV